MSQFKHATAASMDVDWSWERLISEQHDMLDAVWSTVVAQPRLVTEIPAEHQAAVLLPGSATCDMDHFKLGQYKFNGLHLL